MIFKNKLKLRGKNQNIEFPRNNVIKLYIRVRMDYLKLSNLSSNNFLNEFIIEIRNHYFNTKIKFYIFLIKADI